MKKLLAVLMVLAMVVAVFVACEAEDATPEFDPNAKSEGSMTYAQYSEAKVDDEVVIEGFVQAKQSWWDNKANVYLQDGDGAYFVYELACTEDEYKTLTIGTKIKVKGSKGEWDGEVEVMDATFELLESDPYVAEALDVTDLLGKDDLIKHQNMFVTFKDMTVEKVSFKNDEPGDDIYVTLKKGDASYSFCVEMYLTGPDTQVYKDVSALKEGDVIDVEGFLYWWNGPNTHITSVAK